MIERFQIISSKNIGFEVNLNPKGLIYKDQDAEIAREVFNNKYNGIKWLFNNREIIKLDENRNIDGYPSIDKNYVIAIFLQTDPIYPSPKNLVIYNADGSEHLQLSPPVLISDLAKTRKPYMNYEASFRLWFSRAFWKINDNGEVVNTVRIGFDREWYEERVLNPETGELGECLSSGRY